MPLHAHTTDATSLTAHTHHTHIRHVRLAGRGARGTVEAWRAWTVARWVTQTVCASEPTRGTRGRCPIYTVESARALNHRRPRGAGRSHGHLTGQSKRWGSTALSTVHGAAQCDPTWCLLGRRRPSGAIVPSHTRARACWRRNAAGATEAARWARGLQPPAAEGPRGAQLLVPPQAAALVVRTGEVARGDSHAHRRAAAVRAVRHEERRAGPGATF